MTAGSEGSLVLEARFGQAVVDELNRRGWQTQVTNPFDDLMGTAQLIEVSESRGCYIAASDPRGDSSALAV
jgi:gamma-glutamyltranspeptidase